MSDVSAFVKRTRNADRDDINKLLSLITPIAFAQPEDAGAQERITLSKATRLRSNTVTAGALDVSQSSTRNRDEGNPRRLIPATVNSYPLTHTPTGTFTPVKTILSKFGAGIKNGGSSWISVANHADLNVTAELTMGCWFYASGFTGSVRNILEKRTSTTDGFRMYLSSGSNTINSEWICASGTVTRSTSFTPNTWNSWVATYDSTNGAQAWLNGSSIGTVGNSGAILTNSLVLGIFSNETGGDLMDSATALAFIFLGNFEATSAWVTNFHDGVYDMTTFAEILKIDGIGDERPTPLSESGLFRS